MDCLESNEDAEEIHVHKCSYMFQGCREQVPILFFYLNNYSNLFDHSFWISCFTEWPHARGQQTAESDVVGSCEVGSKTTGARAEHTAWETQGTQQNKLPWQVCKTRA